MKIEFKTNVNHSNSYNSTMIVLGSSTSNSSSSSSSRLQQVIPIAKNSSLVIS